jgi:multiple sugar transport system permease protein
MAGSSTSTGQRPGRSRAMTWLAIVYTLAILFPVFWMMTLMVKPEVVMFIRPTVWLFEPTLDHFAFLLDEGFLWHLWSSLIVASASTVLVVIIGTPAAYAFARFPIRRSDDLFIFILATRMAPPVCLIIPFYLIYAKIGLIDTYIGLVLAYLTFNLSFYVWVMRSFCRDLPVELEEAALVSGYPRWQVLLKIVFPLVRPGMVSAAVLCFIFAWNEFLYAFMLGGDKIKTLPVGIPTLITTQGVRWGEMSVVGIVGLLPVLVAVFFLQKHIVRGLTMGAVKG